MDERDLGLKIKARREEMGLSQKDFANFLSIDQGRVSLLERGARRIDMIKELPLIAKFLKVSINWFFDELDIQMDKTPTELLLEQYFPDKQFQKMEIEKIRIYIENVLHALLLCNLDLTKTNTKVQKSNPSQKSKKAGSGFIDAAMFTEEELKQTAKTYLSQEPKRKILDIED